MAQRRRRSFRFTRQGRVFVAVTIGVGLAAVNTGNNLLYLVLGLMLSLLLVSGTLSDLALWRLRLRRRVPSRAFAGAPALVEVEVKNIKARLPSYSLEVEDRVVDEEAAERRCFFLKIGPQVSQRATYRRTPLRRGLLEFENFVVRTRFPFGLIEKGRHMAAPGDMLVYPRLVSVEGDPVLVGLDGDDISVPRAGMGADVAGLRAYREGDEARSIHWLRSAAFADGLIVRERSKDSRARLSIVLDQREPDELDESWRDAFEEAISKAASLAEAALARGAAVEVLCRGESSALVLPGAAPDPIWRFLALLESRPHGDSTPMPRPGGRVLEVTVAA